MENVNILDILHRFKRSAVEIKPEEDDVNPSLESRSIILYATAVVSDAISHVLEEIRSQINLLTKNALNLLRLLRRSGPSADVLEEIKNSVINYGVDFLIEIVNQLNSLINDSLDRLLGQTDEEPTQDENKIKTFGFLGNICASLNKTLTNLVIKLTSTVDNVTFGMFKAQLEMVRVFVNGLINRIFPPGEVTAKFLYIN